MNEECGESGCDDHAVLFFFAIDRRMCALEECRCEVHGMDYWKMRLSEERSPRLFAADERGVRCFDITLVVLDNRSQAAWIRLREECGPRDVTLAVGTVEGWALLHELRHMVTARPLTHRAMFSAITALGGTLDHVVIDSFDSASRVFHAKIRMRQRNDLLEIDVRPSDAITLAAITGAPIWVADTALANR